MQYLTILALSFCYSTILRADIRGQIDELFQNYDQPDVPGASVLVIEDGGVFYQNSYGLARLSPSKPASSYTNYRLASLSKSFTAMAIMILVERGELNLEDKIQKYIPEFPDFAREIRIRHLLSHQSGLRDYEGRLPSGNSQINDEGVVSILLKSQSLYFTPGQSYRYSNSGYATLAAIVARTSGRSYQEFLKTEIFIPLTMHSTVAFVDGFNRVPNRAYGYTRSGTSFRFADQSRTSAVLGDGGVYSSLNDMFAWDQAFYGSNPIVSDATLGSILRPNKLSSGAATSYGFGWVIDQYRGHRRESHTGSTIGQRSSIQRLPEQQLSVIVLVNRADVAPWETGRRVLDLMLDQDRD